MPNKHHFNKNEPYYKRAKFNGYRARSAYKLLDIQNRYKIFKRAFYILDLGSAPGSWLQVAKKIAEDNLEKYKDQYYHREYYRIMGVDIKSITPIENVKILKMDFTTPKFNNEIESYFKDKLDLILSDASISKIGNKFTDQIRQINLCYNVLTIVLKFLKYKGNFVMKAFQGSDFAELTEHLLTEFKIFKIFKPQSSKKKSNEIYLIGLQKK
ncbi:MAG: SAM-dependent methyltransferase [Promethearchaeota archaeon]